MRLRYVPPRGPTPRCTLGTTATHLGPSSSLVPTLTQRLAPRLSLCDVQALLETYKATELHAFIVAADPYAILAFCLALLVVMQMVSAGTRGHTAAERPCVGTLASHPNPHKTRG